MYLSASFLGCSKRTTAVLLEPALSTTSVSIICPQVENFGFPNNRAFVSVQDQTGTAITDFALGNFVASENGTPCVVLGYKKVNNIADPLSTAIVIDRSGSMGWSSAMSDAKTAAIAYVNAMAATDFAEIVLYDNEVEVPQTFTNDKALLIAAINSAYARGGTATFEGAVKGADDLSLRSGRKTILVMTDGDDASQPETEATAIIKINKAGIAAFCVGFGGSANMTNLDNLSRGTGGQSFTATTLNELIGRFTGIFYIMNNLVEVDFRSRIGDVLPLDNTRELTVYLNYTGLNKSCKKKYGY